MKKLSEMNEAELRDVEAPWPKTLEELNQVLNELTERQHDYGTSVYAISLAALAAYNYAASKVGASGFQASCADMDILKRTRHMEDGFRIIDYNKLLYPQYLTDEHFPTAEQLIEENKNHLKEKAEKLLAEKDYANESVRKHWKKIASL